MELDSKYEMFYNRLSKVYKHFGKIARKSNITCFRIYDLDLPEFPFAIDMYENHVHVSEYKRNHNLSEYEHAAWLAKSIDIIAYILERAKENIHLKTRKVIEDRTEQYQKINEQNNFFTVKEANLNFRVNLDDYLDTGLFMDHRILRSQVRDLSEHKKILNLFAYTGAFSVYAAAGKAEEIWTIDLSNTYIDWAKENMAANGFTNKEKYKFFINDVMTVLPTLPNAYFDIIILDPPTFSNSKKMNDILNIQRDHVYLVNHSLKKLKDQGILYFSTNFSKFKIQGDLINGKVTDITKQSMPFDFVKMVRWCYKITLS